MRRRKWLIPVGRTVLGVAVVALGIAWAVVTGVAIPDQDPTPAMREYARFHTRIVNGLLFGGFVTLAAAVVSVPVVFVAGYVGSRSRD